LNENELTQPQTSAGTRLFLGLAMGIGVLALAGLYRFNPSEYHFFPRCVFHAVSGLECPGCGGQRALHQLLHGHLSAAFRDNALLVMLLPVGAWYLLRHVVRALTGRVLPAPFRHHFWPWALTGLVIMFGIARNLPGFEWLRP